MIRTPVIRIVNTLLLLSGTTSTAKAAETTTLVVPLLNDAKTVEDLDRVKSAIQTNGIEVDLIAPSNGVTLVETDEQGNGRARAVGVATSSVDSVEAALVEADDTDPRRGGSALSQLRNGFRSSPLDGFTVGPLGTSTDVAKLPGDRSLAAAVMRASYLGIRINAARLSDLPNSGSFNQTAKGSSDIQDFASHYKDFVGSLYGVLTAPSEIALSSLTNQAEITRESFITNWRAFAKDPRARALAVRTIDAIRSQPELKAVYAVQTSFAPSSYQTIFETAQRLAVVTDAAGKSLCSGLAITRNWILTARHCVKADLGDLRVRLANNKGNLGPLLALERQWPPPDVSYDETALDYTILAVASQPTTSDLPPLCLRLRDASFEEPLIAIGYAQGIELVYDAAYVWYPYRLLPKAFDRVAAMTIIRLQRLSEALPGSATEREAFFQRELKSFQQAYSQSTGNGLTLTRLYQAPLTNDALLRPRFGFDTDTRHGDSGAAVFSRRDNCVVGVFAGGRPDAATLSEANWMEHEFGTPISEVLADVDKRREQTDSAATEDTDLVKLFAAIDGARR